MESGEDARRAATLTFLRGALVSLALALTAGALAVLYYTPALGERLRDAGLHFTALRPLHTTFAHAWIFLGALAVVHRYLHSQSPAADRAERWRLRGTVCAWALAGAGVLLTLPLRVLSGREYLGFHPALSAPILLGWLLFAWSFFRVTWRGFWERPVYVSMWGVGAVFFVVTFVEQHAWLLPGVFADPIVDMRLQWKACGTLVGSFNLFVYGTLYYLGERLTGDEGYARSRVAYALFAVGLLNSFTNFAHHTYHLPQSHLVKWISFTISMTEAVILAKALWDIARALRGARRQPFAAPRFLISAARWWSCVMLFESILISIPPLNALVHGTHVIPGHAMGAEIGIDSMVLLGAAAWLLAEARGGAASPAGDAVLHGAGVRWGALALNVCAAGLVAWLHVAGAVTGWHRYHGHPSPDWVLQGNAALLPALGLGVATALAALLACWLPRAFARPVGVPLVKAPRASA